MCDHVSEHTVVMMKALRRAMTLPRLNDLMLAHVHKDRADEMNTNEIGKQFISKNEWG